MKKAISVFLSCILLLSAVIVAIPATATTDTDPIEATPIVDWTNSTAMYLTAKNTVAQPLGWTIAQGISMLPSSTYETTGYQATNLSSSAAFAYALMNEDFTTGDATHFLMYVKLDAANTILPSVGIDLNFGYFPAMTLAGGKDYSYVEIDGTEWQDGTSDSNGAIKFDSAFEGYIKFKLTDLSGENGTVGFNSTRKVSEIRCRLQGLGGDYGNAVVGPFFLVTADSTSTKINVPEEYKPAPIEATPIIDWTNSTAMYLTAKNTVAQPLGWTIAQGISMLPSSTYETTGYQATNLSSSAAFAYALMNEDFTTGDATHFLMYVKLDSANTILPSLEVDLGWSYNPGFKIVSKSYSYASLNDTEWKDGTSDSNGAIKFDSAFEGYIKFSISDLSGDVGFNNTRKVSEIRCRLEGLGGDYGNAVVGPFFLVTADSTSTKINVPDEYKPQPIKVTTLNDWALREYSWQYSSTDIFNPFDWTAAKGVIMKPSAQLSTGAYEFEITESVGLRSSKAYSCVSLTNAVSVTDVTDIIMYVKTDKKNTILPVFTMDLNNGTSATREMSLIPGTKYYIAELGAQEWKEGEVEYCGAVGGDENTGGGISFNGAFEGYIKFDINNLRASDKLFSSDYLIFEIRCFIKGIGGDYSSSIITGPYFTTTADSTSTEIEMHEIDGDIDFDAVLTLNDVTLLRQHLLGTANAFVTKYGNANEDTEGLIDICDLVYVNEKYEQVVFSKFFDTKAEVTDYAYSFAVVGDTQHVARSYTSEMSKIYDWILSNQESKKIKHVFGLGDITDGDNDFEWEAAQNAINKMNGVLPYSLVRGNHDSVAQFEKYFATDAYKSQFSGTFYTDDDEAIEGEITNSYKTFEVDGTKYLFLTLDYLSDTDRGGDIPGQPLSAEEQDEIIAWAKGVIDAHSEYKVIISTHNYVQANGTITTDNDIESAIVSQCPNVFLVLGGHIESERIVCNQTDYTTHKVTSLLINPQSLDIRYNGGTGLVAMLYFKNDGTIEVEYYSTIREQFFMEENQFTITVE